MLVFPSCLLAHLCVPPPAGTQQSLMCTDTPNSGHTVHDKWTRRKPYTGEKTVNYMDSWYSPERRERSAQQITSLRKMISFSRCCCSLCQNREMAKPYTSMWRWWIARSTFCQKITRVQGKTKSSMLISVIVVIAFEYCFHFSFSFYE